jgi:RHS repeat-associated protein
VIGRLTQTEDAQADYTTMTYDAAGLELTATDPLNHQTSMVYDGFKRGLVAQTISDAGKALQESTLSSYDANGQDISDRDPNGYTSTSAYNAVGEVTLSTDPLGAVNMMTYDLAGQETAVRDPLGNLTKDAYNNRGFETTVTDAKGDVTSMGYDAAGNETTVTDPLNHTTTYAYDALNRETVVTDPNGNSVTTAYDAAGRVGTVTNARGFNTTYAYNAADEQTSVTEAAGTSNARTTTTGYDKAGNITSQTDGINTVTYAYDKANRQTATTDGLNHTTTTAYDAAGNATAVTDALNKITTYVYDDLNRQVAVTDPNNHTTTTLYDADGNQVGTLDPLGDLSQTGYDADGRVIWQLDPDRNLTQTFYDAAGNETALTDPVNNTTTFAYDTLNRQTGQTNPNGSLVTMAYDAASRLTSTIDADSRTITYAYDAGDRLTGSTWKNSSGTVVNTLTYTYDQNGNMLTAADTNGTITFAYDNRDRVTVRTDVHGVTLTFAYDAADRRTLVQDSLGGTVTSVYDAANRLTSRQLGAVGTLTNAARVDFAYNKRDALTTLTRFSDAAGTTVVGTTIYSYDNANRVTTILNDNASNATLSYYAYNYDNADRVTSQNWKTGSTTGAETYTYDPASQLLTDASTATGTATYTYDSNGNRTLAGYQTGNGNELTNDGTYTYTYDSAGNMTQKSKGSGLETWYYGYDNLNHLTSVRETTNGTTNELTVTYTYDVLGDRIQQDKWKTGGSTVSTRFDYDGANVFADTDTSNNVLARYLYGDGADQILARSVAAGQTNAGVAFYLTAMLGSVRDLENTSQTIIDHLDYSAFGVVTETAPSAGDRYKFEAGQYDSDTGQEKFGRRIYTPATGTWTSQDPIFPQSGPNPYEYVGNDPTNATDPSGLDKLTYVTLDPKSLIKFEAEPKKVGTVNGGDVSYAIGKLPLGINSGLYLQYKGPDADKVFFIQFIALKASILDKDGKKIKDINDLPPFKEEDNHNLAIRKGLPIGYKDDHLVWSVDGYHPAGVAGVPNKEGRTSMGGKTKDGIVWTFDAPDIPRVIAVRNIEEATKRKLGKDQKLLFEMDVIDYIVKQDDKTFKVLGRVNWSASASVYWRKGFVKDGLIIDDDWVASLSKAKYGNFEEGPGKDFSVFQQAYQNNLKLHEDKEGYKLAK